MVQKIKDFILKDVQSENETKKTAVTLRISALMLCLYFLSLFAVFCAIKDIRSAVICLVCIGCYLVSFYTTYLNHTKFASIFSQTLMGAMDSDFYLGVRLGLRCTTFCVCASGSQFYCERGNDGDEDRCRGTGVCVPYFSVCLYEQV